MTFENIYAHALLDDEEIRRVTNITSLVVCVVCVCLFVVGVIRHSRT